MNTKDVMNLSLELAGFDKIPEDSQIFYSGENVSRILFGIDIWPEDIGYAKEHGYDLVISHHPPCLIPGKGFLKVLSRHVEFMRFAGISEEEAQKVLSEVKKFVLSLPHLDFTKNHDEITVKAKELNMPLMNIHLACDELGRAILQQIADDLGTKATVSQLIGAFEDIPEIKKSSEDVHLICGSLDSRTGKTLVIHGAGSNGGYPVANALFDSGVNTVIYIYLLPSQQSDAKRLRKENKGNLIVTGHDASDSIGINCLIDELERQNITVDSCNGLIR